MQIASQIQKLFATMVGRRGFRFTCGNCERNAQCGLPPHDDCIYRLMQIALDSDRSSRRNECLNPAVWPLAGGRYEIGRY
jgi:hypothetical protein